MVEGVRMLPFVPSPKEDLDLVPAPVEDEEVPLTVPVHIQAGELAEIETSRPGERELDATGIPDGNARVQAGAKSLSQGRGGQGQACEEE